MGTIKGDPDLGWNPYYGAPTCNLCGSIKAGKYDKCKCEERCGDKPINYNSKEYREFSEWLEKGGKLKNKIVNP